ncbi:hypothetical protein PGT21_013180 [Puccinia graminis f. sp. tritici]|uniref:Uncharacterized protein n=1 Tax=Puccinia graminis f. sp. tritici TaxID=56615 RepID=A0A5B0MB25_PUCGR|nr:hypothetical protein PGT21_013180 [Puccinia graminis f. sp. tritici]
MLAAARSYVGNMFNLAMIGPQGIAIRESLMPFARLDLAEAIFIHITHHNHGRPSITIPNLPLWKLQLSTRANSLFSNTCLDVELQWQVRNDGTPPQRLLGG